MRFLGILFAALLTIVFAGSTAWAVIEDTGRDSTSPRVGTSQQQYSKAVRSEADPISPAILQDKTATIVLTSYEGVTVLESSTNDENLSSFLLSKGQSLEDYRTEKGKSVSPDRPLKDRETLFLFKVEYKSSSEQVTLDSPIEKVDSAFMPIGTEVTLTVGAPGTALVTRVASVNLSSFKKMNSKANPRAIKRNTVETFTIVKAPTPTTVLVGTGEEPDEVDPDSIIEGLLYPITDPYITSPFGMRVHPVTGVYKLHDGTDFDADCGEEVTAATGGVVVSAEMKTGYGNQVELDHGGGFHTSYSHLTSFSVKPGDVLAPGDLVGLAGTTGYSTGCHLHFMTIIDGEPLDPMGFFNG